MDLQAQRQNNSGELKVQKIYNLSHMQEGMLFHSIFEKDSSAYFQQISFTVKGEFHADLFEKSLNIIVARHDILRTNFVHEKVKRPQQVVFKQRHITAHYEDLSHRSEQDKQTCIDNFLKTDINTNFDLLKGALIRLSILKLDEGSYKVVISNHHIIMDGWSIGIITREVLQTYNMLLRNEPIEFPEPQPYSTYINWLKQLPSEESAPYWKEYLDCYEQQSGLPKLYKKAGEGEYLYEEAGVTFDKELTKRLNNLAKENLVTLNTVIQSIWGLLLQKYNNVEDAVFGSVVSGRPPEIANVENMVGLFINLIPVRIKCEKDWSFSTLIKQVQNHAFKSNRHQYYPISEIQSATSLKQGLLDNIMEFENYPLEKALLASKEEQQFSISDVKLFMQSNYNLSISVIPGEELEFRFRYNALNCDRQFMSAIGGHLSKIAAQVADNPEIMIKDLEIITDEERLQILNYFNNTNTDFPCHKTLQELFEKQVEMTPASTAIVYENQILTYAELNAKANRLARLLREKGVKRNDLVAIFFRRSPEMIISILAVLKSGGAYLPIDPEYPKERIAGILEDSGASTVLTHSSLANKLGDHELIILDNITKILDQKSGENLEPVNSSDDLAYVMYTSGSTGKPKGNLITHYNISRVVKNTNYIDITEKDTVLQLSNYSFDGSTFDIYGALLNGAKLVTVNQDILLDVAELSELIKNQGITLFFVTTALFNALVDVNIDCFKTIRKVLFGGERVSVRHVAKAFEFMGPGRMIHVYGPTESTVFATYHNVNEINNRLSTIPIGKPLSNTKIYIMASDGKLQPVGIPGELCISGKGLAKGYFNRPELTAEKFVQNPFIYGERLYKTGDLARWLPDGSIEFLDRMDTQIKLRGFRIELGEIEAQLLKHENVREAVVLCREDNDGNKFLCAYIVADAELLEMDLRSHLSRELPDYMIPSHFAQLQSMPLTPNGKIDKKILNEYAVKIESEIEYVAPASEVEKILAEVWQEVLGAKRIGVNDNYFSQGGDSIKAIQIASRLQKQQLKMEIKDLFQHPTIRELNSYIKTTGKKAQQSVVTGEAPLTPIQSWFFKEQFTDMHHFNHSVMLHSMNGFDSLVIEKVFRKIVEHHDALRMVYNIENERVIQYNRGIEGQLMDFEDIDLSKEVDCASRIKEEANRAQSGINLAEGPLVKLRLFKTTQGDHLLIIIHHLVVDGVSWRIILEDFATGYLQASKGQDIVFQDKTNSFKDWTQKLNAYAVGGKLEEQEKYWEKVLRNEILPLPKDGVVKENRIKDSSDITLELSEEETEKLLKDVNTAYNTQINDILISALGLALKEWCGNDKFLIGLEGHGREDIIEGIDINRTVGWFTSVYPIVLNMAKNGDITYSIKSVKDELNRIPNKGIGYGMLEFLSPDRTKGALQFGKKPEISFNYLGQFDQDIKTEVFNISKYSTGDSVSPYMERRCSLDINGLVKDSRLRLTLNYNNEEYRETTVAALAHSYKKCILSIIDHCVNKAETELTPTDFLYNQLSIEELDEITRELENPDIQNIYSLTPMQEGMLYNSIANEGSHAYFEQLSFDVHSEMDVSLLEKSLNAIIQRHEILRSVFNYKKAKRPIQNILKERFANVYYEDLTHIDEKENYIKDFKEKDKEKGFDLSRDILIRLAVFKTEAQTYKLVFGFHHILMDGWCIGIIVKEFFQIYKSLEESKPIELDRVYSYGSYIGWLEKQDRREAREYWRKYLEGYEQQATLPKSGKLYEIGKYDYEDYIFKLDRDLTKGLAGIAGKNNVTINTVFQALWGILLKRYNSLEDVVFGAVVSGRPHEVVGVDKMVGLFINTIPVRVRFEKDKPFNQIIKELQTASLESEKYDYFPLAQIQADTELKQGLLDHILVFENYPLEDEIANSNGGKGLYGYKIDNVEVFEQTSYDFNIMVMPGSEMTVKLSYNALVYQRDFIRNIEGHLKKIANVVLENDGTNTSDIYILTEEEEKRILFDFNNTRADYPREKTIHRLFEEQVERTPDSIALVFGNSTLTHRQFNEKANQLARVLREKGIKPDSIVGIMLERSFEMMIGIMGVLKAGGAYLPIDPEYPADRIKFILEDSGAGVLLVNNLESEDDKYIDITSGEMPVTLMNLGDEELYIGDGSNSENISTPNDLAYVIYTSGSTGKPKGVLIEHVSVVNILTQLQKKYPLGEHDTYLLKTTYTFDVSVAELFGWFHENGRLAILEPGGEKNPRSIIKAVDTYGVTHINFVPSMFNVLLNTLEGNEARILERLRYIFVAGEAISGETVRKFYNTVKGVRLENIYGPTESTIYATGCSLNGLEDTANMPIGKPLQNIKAYIADKSNNLQPVGVPGELCIAGDGLARGYLNRPELTAEKFVLNPFETADRGPMAEKNHLLQSEEPVAESQLMYRTGDLVRWLQDGNIEFLGRIDHQVKVRGYRIELGEIESRLLKHESIIEALVMARDDQKGNKYLCAYTVCTQELKTQDLREYLSKELPEYMIPSYFVQLDRMPLTPNGKVDRKTLPEPEKNLCTQVEYVEPRNETEEKIAVVFKEVLGVERVGIKDNFFELGGDSIKAIQVSARLGKYKLKLEMRDLFKYRTIEDLAGVASKHESAEIDQGAVKGEVFLAPMQHWFFENRFTNMNHWNQSVMLQGKNGFDADIVEKVFKRIIEHHDALRIVYRIEENRVVQYNRDIGEGEPLKLDVFDFTGDENYSARIAQEADRLQGSIDLEYGPLVKLALFKTVEGDHLLIVVHHLVIDGVSWRIIFEDFATGYSQAINNEEIRFADKTHSFMEWTSRLKEYGQSKEIQAEIKYWNTIEASNRSLLSVDNLISGNSRIKDCETLELSFTEEETAKLIKQANKAYNTEINDLLLAALGLTVKEWSKQDKVLINLEGHGREDIIKGINITRTIGWFTSQYPVMLDMSSSEHMSHIIKTVKEDLRRIPNKGIGYGILRYLTQDESKNMEFKQNPEICFNYLGQLGQDLNTDLFGLSPFSTGHLVSPESESRYKLNINGMITGERFVVIFNYNKLQYNIHTIQKFIESFRKNLVNIIEHCIQTYETKKEAELTPSDVGDLNLSMEDLKYMSDFLNTL